MGTITQTGSRKNLTALGYWAEQELKKTEQGVNGSVLVQQSGLQCNPAEGCTHCSALMSQLGTWYMMHLRHCGAALMELLCCAGTTMCWHRQCHHCDRLGTHIRDYMV